MSDYIPKVHHDGPDEQVVEDGGVITVKSGGVIALEAGAVMTGTGGADYPRDVVRHISGAAGRVGATAGWTNASDVGVAKLPASQTGSTFVLPLSGMKVGDEITAFKVVAQIESAGGAVTLDADLRKVTNAAADPVDASVGAITQVSVVADTAVGAVKDSLSEVVQAGEFFYILLTGTTAALTDIQLLGVELSISES